MSPEQALGRKLDARSDVFSIGTILYELLAGRRAFDGSTIDETLAQVISDTPASLAGLRPELPARLVEICNKALEKDIDKRYQTAGDLRNDLAAFAGQPGTNAANQARYGTQGGKRALVANVGALLWQRVPARSIGITLVGALVVIAWFALRDPPPAPAADIPPAHAVVAPPPVVVETAPPVFAPVEVSPPMVVEPPKVQRKPQRVARAEKATVQPVSAAEGFVALAVTPWGEIFIDGTSRGVSPPLQRLALPAGTHTIEVRNGSEPAFTASVEVKPGQTLSFQHRF
jgi:serine/threonine-protein kinase